MFNNLCRHSAPCGTELTFFGLETVLWLFQLLFQFASVASMILELNIAIVPMVAHGKTKIFT